MIQLGVSWHADRGSRAQKLVFLEKHEHEPPGKRTDATERRTKRPVSEGPATTQIRFYGKDDTRIHGKLPVANPDCDVLRLRNKAMSFCPYARMRHVCTFLDV